MSLKTTTGEPLRGFARYMPHEHSIAFEYDVPQAQALGLDRASLDTALEIGSLTLAARRSDGRIAFPEGYHPRESWVEGSVPVPDSPKGVLLWEPALDLVQGGALGLADVASISTTFEPSTGWLVVRLDAAAIASDRGLTTVEFCGGAIAGLDESRLVAVWIRLHESKSPSDSRVTRSG
jgi:hypothetical protein